MSNVQPIAPRKAMTRLERECLKLAGRELAQAKIGGAAALAALMVMIANWHGDRGTLGFHDYARLWLQDGNAKGAASETLLRDLFGLNGKPKEGA
ncbi:TPA: hypothetical protein OM995_000784 [Pseudomonas aeruginosa]|uniref:hypothetical protein n=1 Tax=Pseudomonas aeruginosa TaxID=287 RepID=UPI00193C6691|nr:hypothetical protein [Pseudomonas aeruginosa]EJO5052871.1 hypothetical protein [Pseudomonas aeruginosa]MBM2541877.1 hypothetical protein [Pseudomonas aeruginosa]MBO3825785.1 hypothetical protein [Pseudomonas aeruginosa]MBX5792865.1 hypothetical protein [Pseudomonas aeruginosa]MDA3263735.1 hypothetical protein [Pseudomonas aeruginosa]